MENDVKVATYLETRTAASDFAVRINDAVARDDGKLYSETMTNINDWTRLHTPTNQRDFDEFLMQDVDMKPAALYETKQNFSRIDLDKNNELTQDELYAFASRKDANELQEALLKDAIKEDIFSIAFDSKDKTVAYREYRHPVIGLEDIDGALNKVADLKADGKYMPHGRRVSASYDRNFLDSNTIIAYSNENPSNTTAQRNGWNSYGSNDRYNPVNRAGGGHVGLESRFGYGAYRDENGQARNAYGAIIKSEKGDVQNDAAPKTVNTEMLTEHLPTGEQWKEQFNKYSDALKKLLAPKGK